jgi:hypothetical protein
MSCFRRSALLAALLLSGSAACSSSQSSANALADEEPTRGLIELAPTGTVSSFRPALTAPTDPASINAPVLLVNGERLQLRRVEQ